MSNTFYSVGTGGGGGPPAEKHRPVFVETRADFAKGGAPPSATVMQMQFPGQRPEYGVVETRPPLAVMDISGSLDPYVEVKVGNYKGVTRHLEKNQYPVWNAVFTFSKERLQSNLIEVTVKDKDFGKDDFVGKVVFDVAEVPQRVPPDSPLAPQWYKLANKKGEKSHDQGEIMLAV